jgi:hypothetical protein
MEESKLLKKLNLENFVFKNLKHGFKILSLVSNYRLLEEAFSKIVMSESVTLFKALKDKDVLDPEISNIVEKVTALKEKLPTLPEGDEKYALEKEVEAIEKKQNETILNFVLANPQILDNLDIKPEIQEQKLALNQKKNDLMIDIVESLPLALGIEKLDLDMEETLVVLFACTREKKNQIPDFFFKSVQAMIQKNDLLSIKDTTESGLI